MTRSGVRRDGIIASLHTFIRETRSGCLPPPSPPREKAAAREYEAWQSAAADGAGNRLGLRDLDVTGFGNPNLTEVVRYPIWI
jgi:hypothetical protein